MGGAAQGKESVGQAMACGAVRSQLQLYVCQGASAALVIQTGSDSTATMSPHVPLVVASPTSPRTCARSC